jgi:hypothetical protein
MWLLGESGKKKKKKKNKKKRRRRGVGYLMQR